MASLVDTGVGTKAMLERIPNIYLFVLSVTLTLLIAMTANKIRKSFQPADNKAPVGNDLATWSDDLVDTEYLDSEEIKRGMRRQADIEDIVKAVRRRTMDDEARVRQMRRKSKRERKRSKKRHRSRVYRPLDKLRAGVKTNVDIGGAEVATSAGKGTEPMIPMKGIEEDVEEDSREEETLNEKQCEGSSTMSESKL